MRQRYFIAHLLSGPAEEYHHRLVDELAKKFELKTSSGYFPTHITLKAPFETDNDEILAIKQILRKVSQTSEAPLYMIHGFGHFGRHIITLDVIHSHEVEHLHARLVKRLKTVPSLTWSTHEPIMHLHVAIAKKDIEPQFNKIWDYLKEKEFPVIHARLSNIVLLRFEDNAWVIDSFYSIGPRSI